MTTWYHDERLAAVLQAIRDSGAASVLDLGCGSGDLLVRLLDDPALTRLTALDLSAEALERLRARLGPRTADPRLTLLHGTMTKADPTLAGHDCAVLVETIEHLSPSELPALDYVVFATLRPATVIVTTPNAEFNPLLGVPAHRFRHPGHRFEWGRARFGQWAGDTARRHGYTVALHAIAGQHPDLGGASQMAVFTRTD
jgi:3' terminal RNA ribose 2'-O-methyltransferase Hen1